MPCCFHQSEWLTQYHSKRFHAEQNTQALPVATTQPSNTSSDNTDTNTGALPQTGNSKSNVFVELIGLGFVAIPALAFVEYIRRHQTSGID